MSERNTGYRLREVIVIPILLVLLVISLVAHDWRSGIIAATGSAYLVGRRWGTLTRSRLAERYRRLPRLWQGLLEFLLVALLVLVPITLLSDWRDVRVPVLLAGIAVAVAWLGWWIWRGQRAREDRMT
jgi:hypothetical protein